MRVATVLLACAVVVSAAQTNAPLPSFEVASVKPTPPAEQSRPFRMQSFGRPGQFTCTNVWLSSLIQMAYDVPR